MSSNFLQFNEAKTEVLIIAPDSIIPKVKNIIGYLKDNVRSNIRNLGVNFDQCSLFILELILKF